MYLAAKARERQERSRVSNGPSRNIPTKKRKHKINLSMEAAAQLLHRAVDLHKNERLPEALVCYEQGIQQLMGLLKSVPPERQRALRDKIETYMKTAEDLKTRIKRERELPSAARTLEKTIQIEAGKIGFSYDVLFRPYLVNAKRARVIDAYIRKHHQLLNFVRFCELCVANRLALIELSTTADPDDMVREKQQQGLRELEQSLHALGVTLRVTYTDGLHDREIVFDNGWIVKSGRGLDIFEPPASPYAIGACDMTMRPCRATNVDVLRVPDG
eukprot:m.104188 g.104188  ORF g.104188 m.104188 type:complete len:273 (+) comp14167_c0_seq1:2651-3469(+)